MSFVSALIFVLPGHAIAPSKHRVIRAPSSEEESKVQSERRPVSEEDQEHKYDNDGDETDSDYNDEEKLDYERAMKNLARKNYSPSQKHKIAHQVVTQRRGFRDRAKHVRFESHISTVQSGATHVDPVKYSEVVNDPKWVEAMNKECDSFREFKAFTVVDHVPAGEKLLSVRWVYKTKLDDKMAETIRRARIVAKGFLQREYADFNETFSGVMELESMRMMVAIAAAENLELDMSDVSTAFLHATLEKPLYMKAPPGFGDIKEGTILRLNKAIYGLKQSGHEWQSELMGQLAELGFKQGIYSDPCVLTKMLRSGRTMIFGVFVDDILKAYHRDDQKEMDEINGELSRRFKIKHLGPVKMLLGARVTRDRGAGMIKLDQAHYVKMLLKAYGFDQCRIDPTPEVKSSGKISSREDSNDPIPPKQDRDSKHNKITVSNYREVVGALLWLQGLTRPDISHAVNIAARDSAEPTIESIMKVKRILRYLYGTPELGLIYTRQDSKTISLTAFGDSTWGDDDKTRKSTTGMVIKVSGAAVSWLTQRQSNIANSSSEAEYIAACETSRRIVGKRIQCAELNRTQDESTPLYCDNQTTIRMIHENTNQNRRKHIDIKHHYIRELASEGMIILHWIETKNQQADIFTKATDKETFITLRDRVMGYAVDVL